VAVAVRLDILVTERLVLEAVALDKVLAMVVKGAVAVRKIVVAVQLRTMVLGMVAPYKAVLVLLREKVQKVVEAVEVGLVAVVVTLAVVAVDLVMPQAVQLQLVTELHQVTLAMEIVALLVT
jgi:hypothetical protein